MADRIDKSTGRDAFVEFGDRLTAWHKKGRTIPAGTVEVPQILEAACLNWTVEGADVALLETGIVEPAPEA